MAVRVQAAEAPAYRQVDCQPCADAEGKRPERPGGRQCIGTGSCECSGGDPESARVCPAEGYYMVTPSMARGSIPGAREMQERLGINARDARAGSGQSRSARERHFEAVVATASSDWALFTCKDPRDKHDGSQCRHWTDCKRGETTKGVLTNSPGIIGWARTNAETCDAEDPNCCLNGYEGFMCEHCVAGRERLGGNCVPCEVTNVQRLAGSLAFGTLMVVFLMHSSIAT